MSSQHNFSDDPNAFDAPQQQTSNATMILIALAVVGGTMFLICGGVIVGGVMMARQVSQQVNAEIESMPFHTVADQSQFHDLVSSGRYAAALEESDRLLQQYPDDKVLHNAKAWLLATCRDDQVRDGELAIEHGTEACELTDWEVMEFVDTLAAAYAEAGDFEKAVKLQQQAIDLDPSKAHAGNFYSRLALYKAAQPYREGVPPQGGTIPEIEPPASLMEEDLESILSDPSRKPDVETDNAEANDDRDPFE